MGEAFEFHEDINGAVVNVRHHGDKIGKFSYCITYFIWYNTFFRKQLFGQVMLKIKNRLSQLEIN